MSNETINIHIDETTEDKDITMHGHPHHHHRPPQDYCVFSGVSAITVGKTAPVSPSIGDLWIDTN